MGAPVQAERTLSDFRVVAGVKVPFKMVTSQDGKKTMEAVAEDIQINVPIDESLFSQ